MIARFLAAAGGLVLGGWGLPLLAQERALLESPCRPGENAPAGRDHRFFERPIDFWGKGLPLEPPGESDPTGPEITGPGGTSGREPRSHDWVQFVQLPGGQMALYELPRPLVRVLEDPSESNIRAYLEWRKVRTDKILRAAERIRRYQEERSRGPEKAPEETGPGTKPSPRGDTDGASADSPLVPVPKAPRDGAPAAVAPPPHRFSIIYFRRSGCRWCDRQDEVLAEWMRAHPEARLEVVEHGTRPGIWIAYGVRGTPTLLMEDPKTGRTRLLEGFRERQDLEGALRALRAPAPSPSPPRKESSTGGADP